MMELIFFSNFNFPVGLKFKFCQFGYLPYNLHTPVLFVQKAILIPWYLFVTATILKGVISILWP